MKFALFIFNFAFKIRATKKIIKLKLMSLGYLPLTLRFLGCSIESSMFNDSKPSLFQARVEGD